MCFYNVLKLCMFNMCVSSARVASLIHAGRAQAGLIHALCAQADFIRVQSAGKF